MTRTGEGHTLVLVRHAKSDWSGDHPDRSRPLAARGRRQAPETGRWLAGNLAGFGLAVVSPSQRARRTWELIASELDDAPAVRWDERVYAASPDDLLGILHELPEDLETVVLVGHNPSLEELVHRLTGDAVTMKTSAVAVIDVPGTWELLGSAPAVLRWAGRPAGA